MEKNFGLSFCMQETLNSFLHSFPAKRLNFFFPRRLLLLLLLLLLLIVIIRITTTSNYDEAKESTSEKSGERKDGFEGM